MVMAKMMANSTHASADAKPWLKRWKPSWYSWITGVRVALLGPDGGNCGPMRMNGSVKICSPRMVVVATTKNVVGRSSGTVILRNFFHHEAPSISAASYNTPGMPCMPATNSTAL